MHRFKEAKEKYESAIALNPYHTKSLQHLVRIALNPYHTKSLQHLVRIALNPYHTKSLQHLVRIALNPYHTKSLQPLVRSSHTQSCHVKSNFMYCRYKYYMSSVEKHRKH